MSNIYYTAHTFSNYYNLLSNEIKPLQNSLNFQLSLPENIRDNYLISILTEKINTLNSIKSEIKTFPSNIVYLVSDSDHTDYSILR